MSEEKLMKTYHMNKNCPFSVKIKGIKFRASHPHKTWFHQKLSLVFIFPKVSFSQVQQNVSQVKQLV